MELEGSAQQPSSEQGQLSQWQGLTPAACQEPGTGSSAFQLARWERRQPRLPRKSHELMHVSAQEQGCAGASQEGRECTGLCFCPLFKEQL